MGCSKSSFQRKDNFIRKKETQRGKRIKLENQIKQFGQNHKKLLSTNELAQLNEAIWALGNLLTENIERNLTFLKQHYYEYGSKANKLLAFQLKKSR